MSVCVCVPHAFPPACLDGRYARRRRRREGRPARSDVLSDELVRPEEDGEVVCASTDDRRHISDNQPRRWRRQRPIVRLPHVKGPAKHLRSTSTRLKLTAFAFPWTVKASFGFGFFFCAVSVGGGVGVQ